MSKIDEYKKELLTALYEAKRNKLTISDVDKNIENIAKKDILGFYEVINNLNKDGLTNISIRKTIGSHYWIKPNADYLTLKGEEHIESLIKIIQQ